MSMVFISVDAAGRIDAAEVDSRENTGVAENVAEWVREGRKVHWVRGPVSLRGRYFEEEVDYEEGRPNEI